MDNHQKPTHVYVGRDSGGCCVALRSDRGDKETAKAVSEFILEGLYVERVDWGTYRNIVSHEPTFMNCGCKREPEKQPVLFAV